MEEQQKEVEERAPYALPMVQIRGTGRIIRKDGTVVNFTLEGASNGPDSRDGNP